MEFRTVRSEYFGGCQCGAIRYSIRVPLRPAYACHCGDCKKQSASAFSMSIAMRFDDIDVVGELVAYKTIAFSGAEKFAYFCPQCGTRLWHRPTNTSEWVTLKAGTLDCAAEISPAGHLWVSKKQPWIALPEGVPVFETQPDDVHAWRTSLE